MVTKSERALKNIILINIIQVDEIQFFFLAALKNGDTVSESWSYFKLTLLHSEWPKLYGVLAVLSAIGLTSL